MANLLPPRPFLDAIAIRTAVLWLFVRIVAPGASAAASGAPYSLVGSPLTSVVVSLFVLVAMRVELWRRSELVFLANLGHSFARIGLFITLECFALDGALWLTLA